MAYDPEKSEALAILDNFKPIQDAVQDFVSQMHGLVTVGYLTEAQADQWIGPAGEALADMWSEIKAGDMQERLMEPDESAALLSNYRQSAL